MKTKRKLPGIKKQGKLLRMLRDYAGIKPWSETERKIILATVRTVKHAGLTADLLGIARTTLHRKLKSYRTKRSA